MLIRKYANHRIYTQVFLVNMTLEKPPWGKPVEEKIYYGVLEKYYSKNKQEEPDLQ
jgi:hypothetical protein